MQTMMKSPWGSIIETLGFCVTLIPATMLDVAWYSLIITMSKRSDYCCATSGADFLTKASDIHRFGSKKQISYRYFLHHELLICTSSDFVQINCKLELWGFKDNRMRMDEHACDYLSSRNALSAIKRIINETTGSTRKHMLVAANVNNTFINYGKSFDKLLSWKHGTKYTQ